MRFSVTVCPDTAPSPDSVLGYSFPSYCPAYANAAFAPFALTTSAMTFTPSFPSGEIVTICVFGAAEVLNWDFEMLSVQCPVWTSCAQPATLTTTKAAMANASFLYIQSPLSGSVASQKTHTSANAIAQ